MRKILCLAFLILIFMPARAQKRYTVSGHISDQSGELLIGANVIVRSLKSGVVSNAYGFYSLTIPEGEYELLFSYISCKNKTLSIKLDKDISINVDLEDAAREIGEVVISAERKDANIRSIEASVTRLQASDIKKISVLMGEADIIKSIQLLPGVQTSSEGSSGFYVRGGNADQNLILLDEAVVYNPSHLFGFFSVFNGDAIKNVELQKGGISAEYGGRLSSVLDVRMKEGNTKKISGEGGVGSISSRFTIDGPIIKDKVSFMLSGRRTYFDLFFPFLKDSVVKKSTVNFYDLNAKITYNINEKNRLFVSGYFGKDVNKFGSLFAINYGNATATIRWNHTYGGKLFSNLTFINSNYAYNLGVPAGSQSFSWLSNIVDYSVRNDYTYFLNPSNTLKFGFLTTFHKLRPGRMGEESKNSFFSNIKIPDTHGIESAIFLQNEQKIGPRLSAIYGLRISMFNNIGKGTIYKFQQGEREYSVVDTLNYKSGEIFKTYWGMEPRIGLRYMINDKNSVKASYNRTLQYMHLASNSTATFPLDLWFMSGPNVKPQRADQVAIGYFRNFFNNSIEFSFETFYKKMYNTIDYRDHAQLVANELLEGELRIGKSYSYGAEFLLRKQSGKLTGWISYSYSRVYRVIPEINNGERYNPAYDKPHNISVVISYDLSRRWQLSGNWVYTSAIPVTVPTSSYYYSGIKYPLYSERGAVRIPGTAYHRMDISLTYNYKIGKLDCSSNISIYNVYNRHNAFVVYFRDKNAIADETKKSTTGNSQVEVIKLYLFPVVPSITLINVKF
jgi:outer membrane cobalamin receptor